MNMVYFIVLGIGSFWWFVLSGLVIIYLCLCLLWEYFSIVCYLFGLFMLLFFFWSVLFLCVDIYFFDFFYGVKLVFFVCFLVWVVDSGVYFVGKSLGKYKMVFVVSLNKMIEGLVGGIVIVMLVGYWVVECFGI